MFDTISAREALDEGLTIIDSPGERMPAVARLRPRTVTKGRVTPLVESEPAFMARLLSCGEASDHFARCTCTRTVEHLSGRRLLPC